MSDCGICRNYKECKSENKDKVDKCFFVYPTEEELAKDTKEYAIGYQQGRADEKRENEQDAYHRGYLDGKIKCSIENERKIISDERKRIKEAIYDFISDEFGKYTGDDRFIVEEWRKELMKINKRLGEIVRGEK